MDAESMEHEVEPARMLQQLREERARSDAAFEAATRTARAITVGLRTSGSQGRLRAHNK